MDGRSALWESGRDETVEVNQRALIDKVLARYSGEYTVLRELLQNADDAQAKRVEIRFETKVFLDLTHSHDSLHPPPATPKILPDLKTEIMSRWIFKNDGVAFREEDWNRLKKIAEGNPDEAKIGAFGVGFYSLFSITEAPFVSSGKSWMGFYWKDGKDQLFVRRGDYDMGDNTTEGNLSPWTSFEMNLRDPRPLPGPPIDMARFLATSITFMTHIKDVTLYVDNHRLVHLAKESGASQRISISPLLQTATTNGLMNVKGISSTNVEIRASVLRWVYATESEKLPPKAHAANTASNFFSSFISSFKVPTPSNPRPVSVALPSADYLDVLDSSVQVQVFSAEVSVKLPNKIAQELERATKKRPPNSYSYQLIYTGKDEYDASIQEDEGRFQMTGSVFKGLRADLDGKGSARIFIGHATAQTTGMGGHHASRFIPTVEREAIDLVDHAVSVWNKELLGVGGFLCRAVYEHELGDIHTRWNALDAQLDSASGARSSLEQRFVHALRFFTFHASTPSALVSQIMETAFFGCAKDGSITVLSTAGVISARDVRYPDPAFMGFLKHLPVLPSTVLEPAEAMILNIRQRGLLSAVTFSDVLRELRSRSLTEAEMVECLKWRIGLADDIILAHREELTHQFFGATAFFIPAQGGATERVVSLASIQTFINVKSGIPIDGPLPIHTMPFSVTKHLPSQRLKPYLGWKQLTVSSWVAYLISSESEFSLGPDNRITTSPEFAEQVFNILVKSWSSIPEPEQQHISQLLKHTTCIPTVLGMRRPNESYLPNVNMFPDLAIVSMPGPMRGDKERLLLSLGVRKHVDLQLIFTREMASGNWSIPKLVTYLVSVRDSLSPIEMDKLRDTRVFPASEGSSVKENTEPLPPLKRYTAAELHEPSGIHLSLQLPVLDWQGEKWRTNSPEGKFLFSLGLRKSPSLEDILHRAASNVPEQRDVALRFFLDQFNSLYASTYKVTDFSTLAFVPAVKADDTDCMGTPIEVFVEQESAIMGFNVVKDYLRAEATAKLQLQHQPPTSLLISRLVADPPRNPAEAQMMFEYLAGRVSSFSAAHLQHLKEMPFIPLAAVDNSPAKFVKPSECYIGQSAARLHSRLFTFVDFGKRASVFLQACGTKLEPTSQQIAEMLISNPKTFYELSGGSESYLEELRRIASNVGRIEKRTQEQMRRAPILLGSRRIVRDNVKISAEGSDDENDGDLEHQLLRPSEIVIVDDTNAYRIFRNDIWVAPQDDLIETFYRGLGAQPLSTVVREDYVPSGDGRNQKLAADTRALVLERLPLFLHDQRGHPTTFRFDWLSRDDNFQVKTVGKLQISSVLVFGGQKIVKPRPASAGAKKDGRGPLVLYLAENDRLDYYEVAHAICRLLFEQHRVNDSLLFMTVLSTELRALKRRGYNVDRILNQQKLDREKREAEARDLRQRVIGRPVEGLESFMNDRKELTEAPKSGAMPLSSDRGLMTNIKQIFRGPLSDTPRSIPNLPGAFPTSPGPFESFGPKLASVDTRARVTPSQDIERNMQLAISACREERSDRVQNRSQMSKVKEANEGNYCDVTGETDLLHVGDMRGYKVYMTQGVSEASEVLKQKQGALQRFSEVIDPLRDQVYRVPLRSVAIFYDLEGPLIAFNRGGSIFLNLRYYEAWHDPQVIKGDLVRARISWYFVLAHEIAHNLVQPHNAEHEFYFSTLCEGHLRRLSPFLGA